MRQTISEHVAASARKLVEQLPHFRTVVAQLDFQCVDGRLIVRGPVPTFYLKQILQRTLLSLEGVERLDNRVHVTYCMEPRHEDQQTCVTESEV